MRNKRPRPVPASHDVTQARVYIGTSIVGKQLNVDPGSVMGWMLRGVTVRGDTHRLQYLRIGKYFKTTQEWVDEFIAKLNADTPAITETLTERKRRAEKAAAEYRAFKNR